MKKLKRSACLLTALLLLPVLLLSGCGKREDPFQVVFAAPFVNDGIIAAYCETLSPATETPIKYSGLSFGSEGMDASTYAASSMMLTAMAFAGEVDVVVCDLAEAARYARSGMFSDLTELFTQAELAEYADRLVRFDEVDENGVPTGEKTPSCGLDLSGREDLNIVMGGTSYGIFLVNGTGDPETAKAVFWEIVKG